MTRELTEQEICAAVDVCSERSDRDLGHEYRGNGCRICRADIVRLVDGTPMAEMETIERLVEVAAIRHDNAPPAVSVPPEAASEGGSITKNLHDTNASDTVREEAYRKALLAVDALATAKTTAREGASIALTAYASALAASQGEAERGVAAVDANMEAKLRTALITDPEVTTALLPFVMGQYGGVPSGLLRELSLASGRVGLRLARSAGECAARSQLVRDEIDRRDESDRCAFPKVGAGEGTPERRGLDRPMFDALQWLMGCADEFTPSPDHRTPTAPYWWRSEFAKRAGLVYDAETGIFLLDNALLEGAQARQEGR